MDTEKQPRYRIEKFLFDNTGPKALTEHALKLEAIEDEGWFYKKSLGTVTAQGSGVLILLLFERKKGVVNEDWGLKGSGDIQESHDYTTLPAHPKELGR